VNEKRTSNSIAGMSAIGALLVGVVSFFGGLFPFINGDYASAGVIWIASAFSFGLLANAVFRD
jgi:hypothetical protein